LELQITLSVSLLVTVGPGSPEREKALVRALELCEQLGDSRMMEMMVSLGIVRWSRREPLLGLQLCEKALALAEQAKDLEVLAGAHAGIAHQLLALGHFDDAREHFEDAIELLGGRQVRKFGQVLITPQTAPFALGLALVFLGYPITALKRSKNALDTVRQRPEPYMSAAPLGVYIMIHLALRDMGTVTEQIEELAAITAEHEIVFYHALAMFYRAWLIVDAGRVKEGLAEMGRIITQLGAAPPVDLLVVVLAEVCGRNGQPDEGLAIINEALTRSEKVPQLQAEFYRLKGELTLLKDPRSKAEAEWCLRQAIDVARRQAARLFE
jgi:adenylate cyclase